MRAGDSCESLSGGAQQLQEAGGVFLVLADGGFSDSAIPPNEHAARTTLTVEPTSGRAIADA